MPCSASMQNSENYPHWSEICAHRMAINTTGRFSDFYERRQRIEPRTLAIAECNDDSQAGIELVGPEAPGASEHYSLLRISVALSREL